jgi:uncharacterized protein YutE (UPF0331/DUF86 family)
LVDPERVSDRLARLEHLLRLLEAVREDGEERYLADEDLRLRAERALQLALQICLDVATHLGTEMALAAPRTYREVFAGLAQAGILDRALAARLQEAAGLRNLLVHGYAELDDRRIFAALGRLDDLRAFAAAAARAAES